MHKRCSRIIGKMNGDSKFKCQACANQQMVVAEDCPGIELNGTSLEIVEKLSW